MEQLNITKTAPRAATGTRASVIIGVVASGNLEVLIERSTDPGACTAEITTASSGFGTIWEAVITDFVARGAGGLRVSINDGGARPDTVSLRLAQGLRMIEAPEA